MSVRQAAGLLNVGKSTAARALKDLSAKGFIFPVDESNWFNGTARSYRLTWQPYKGHEATNEWNKYQEKIKSTVPPTVHSVPPAVRLSQKRPTSGTVDQACNQESVA